MTCDCVVCSTACPVGMQQPREGRRECLNCTAGTYSVASGRQECSKCTPGTFTNANGTVNCPLCAIGEPPNTFVILAGWSVL
jgi:hypothetical protein